MARLLLTYIFTLGGKDAVDLGAYWQIVSGPLLVIWFLHYNTSRQLIYLQFKPVIFVWDDKTSLSHWLIIILSLDISFLGVYLKCAWVRLLLKEVKRAQCDDEVLSYRKKKIMGLNKQIHTSKWVICSYDYIYIWVFLFAPLSGWFILELTYVFDGSLQRGK